MNDGTGQDRWWPGVVLYQLYPRSFPDSDADGYGDLPGVIEQLDYLPGSGSTASGSPSWLRRITDWGYDVSDYMSVHPELGTLADLDHLVARRAASGCESCSISCPTTRAKSTHGSSGTQLDGRLQRIWYVWAEPGPDGAPPNNWLMRAVTALGLLTRRPDSTTCTTSFPPSPI